MLFDGFRSSVPTNVIIERRRLIHSFIHSLVVQGSTRDKGASNKYLYVPVAISKKQDY